MQAAGKRISDTLQRAGIFTGTQQAGTDRPFPG
jgi:hypothetical protein